MFDKERPITVPTVTADNKQSVSTATVVDEKLSPANSKNLTTQVESSKISIVIKQPLPRLLLIITQLMKVLHRIKNQKRYLIVTLL